MQSTPILTLPLIAAAALSANRFTTFAGAVPGAGAKAAGVTQYAAATGDAVAGNVLGTTKVEAGGAIAVGGPIKSDASGKAIAQGGTGEILGYAIEAASADGKIIEMLLTP